MKTPTKYTLLLFALFVLSSCSTTTINSNYIAADLSTDNLEPIAADIVPIIAANNPAKSTAFILPQDEFGQALSDHMGKFGYEVVFGQTEQSQGQGETVRYTIDWIQPQSLYLSLTVNNRERYTRTYTVKQGITTPDEIKMIGVNYGR